MSVLYIWTTIMKVFGARSSEPPVLCSVRQPELPAGSGHSGWELQLLPATVLRCFSHVPAPASAAARILAFSRKSSMLGLCQG